MFPRPAPGFAPDRAINPLSVGPNERTLPDDSGLIAKASYSNNSIPLPPAHDSRQLPPRQSVPPNCRHKFICNFFVPNHTGFSSTPLVSRANQPKQCCDSALQPNSRLQIDTPA